MDELEWGRLLGPIAEGDAEPNGSEWDVTIIKAGGSNNGRTYAAEVLREATPLYDGARVLSRSDEDHLANKSQHVGNIVGWISSPHFDEATKEIRGRLNLSESASHIKSLLLDAWKRGKRDLVGLSHVVDGERRYTRQGGQLVEAVSRITKVRTVDLVVNPAAGGGFVRLVASEGKEVPSVDPEKLFAMLKEADNSAIRGLLKGKDDAFVKSLSEADEDLGKRIAEAMAEKVDDKAPAKAEPKAEPKAVAEADKAKEKTETITEADPDVIPSYLVKTIVRSHLAEAEGLHDVVKAKLEKRFAGRDDVTDDTITEAISDELESWKELEKANLVRSNGHARETGVVVEALDKGRAALAGFFAEEDFKLGGVKIPRYRSFREAYIDFTGDKGFTGIWPDRAEGLLGLRMGQTPGYVPRIAEADGEVTFSEANGLLTTQFDQTAADVMHIKLIRDYSMSNLRTYDGIVERVPLSDFRTNHLVRTGGYGDLPTVAENGTYNALTSPTDEEVTYTPAKKGGTEFVTIEMIANDTIGAIRRIPSKLARAAARTLHKNVFDNIRTNPTLYDAVSLFHATHANTGTAALSVASLNAARVSMMRQVEKDSSEAIGLYPQHLFVPPELEQLAFELTNSQLKPYTNDNDRNFLNVQNLDYTVVPYWSDTNNWYVAAGNDQVPFIQLGFFGPEDPELFVQDMANVGSLFTNDRITWKIRHIYGSVVEEFRGVYGALVP